MKKLIVSILFLLSSFYCFSQEVDTTLTQDEIIKIANHIDSIEIENKFLKEKLEISDQEIKKLNVKIDMMEILRERDRVLSEYRKEEIDLLLQSIEDYKTLQKLNRRAWYDKPAFWIITGATMVYVASEIVSNVK